MGTTKENTERRLRRLEQMGFGDAADYARKANLEVEKAIELMRQVREIVDDLLRSSPRHIVLHSLPEAQKKLSEAIDLLIPF